MARTVDPERYAARRLVIIDAALTVFAERGYDGATTAAICRQAGIGSGTFFHYFPTKRDVLLAILRLGIEDVRERAARYAGRTDPLGVLLDIVAEHAQDAADPRMPGFVRAVGGIMTQPDVAELLREDTEVQHALLRPWVEQGQRAGAVRTDLPASRIVSWLYLLTDGFLGQAASDDGFVPADEAEVLVDTARRFLAPWSGIAP